MFNDLWIYIENNKVFHFNHHFVKQLYQEEVKHAYTCNICDILIPIIVLSSSGCVIINAILLLLICIIPKDRDGDVFQIENLPMNSTMIHTKSALS